MTATVILGAIFKWQGRRFLRQEKSAGHTGYSIAGNEPGAYFNRTPAGIFWLFLALFRISDFLEALYFAPVIVWFEKEHDDSDQHTQDYDSKEYRAHIDF